MLLVKAGQCLPDVTVTLLLQCSPKARASAASLAKLHNCPARLSQTGLVRCSAPRFSMILWSLRTRDPDAAQLTLSSQSESAGLSAQSGSAGLSAQSESAGLSAQSESAGPGAQSESATTQDPSGPPCARRLRKRQPLRPPGLRPAARAVAGDAAAAVPDPCNGQGHWPL